MLPMLAAAQQHVQHTLRGRAQIRMPQYLNADSRSCMLCKSQSSRLAVLRDSPPELVLFLGNTTRCATQYVKDELARGVQWQSLKDVRR